MHQIYAIYLRTQGLLHGTDTSNANMIKSFCYLQIRNIEPVGEVGRSSRIYPRGSVEELQSGI